MTTFGIGGHTIESNVVLQLIYVRHLLVGTILRGCFPYTFLILRGPKDIGYLNIILRHHLDIRKSQGNLNFKSNPYINLGPLDVKIFVGLGTST
jgi:hypothetical protein